MLEKRAEVNAVNNKGQTALHMSVKYEIYWLSKLLLEAGADPKLKNSDGHEAILGLDGDKTGPERWDAPLFMLKNAADSAAELNEAMTQLEKADPTSIEKATLAQAGLQKKKECPLNWDQARFVALLHRA
eukprot:TRINITY_DN26022_c0_g1_i1.p2 TRINITY_DN26022_c0_g1~~TRINITY_DN26022_c0_g1_i1.p2  ORF type:complete len:130 (-),score=43.81 TRINITY_DN26022_c0_g1_i1:98-487(-)